jgi:hypothetical protein
MEQFGMAGGRNDNEIQVFEITSNSGEKVVRGLGIELVIFTNQSRDRNTMVAQ